MGYSVQVYMKYVTNISGIYMKDLLADSLVRVLVHMSIQLTWGFGDMPRGYIHADMSSVKHLYASMYIADMGSE